MHSTTVHEKYLIARTVVLNSKTVNPTRDPSSSQYACGQHGVSSNFRILEPVNPWKGVSSNHMHVGLMCLTTSVFYKAVYPWTGVSYSRCFLHPVYHSVGVRKSGVSYSRCFLQPVYPTTAVSSKWRILQLMNPWTCVSYRRRSLYLVHPTAGVSYNRWILQPVYHTVCVSYIRCTQQPVCSTRDPSSQPHACGIGPTCILKGLDGD